MEFNVITGYYVSHRSFHNNADADNPGQGILQGSSSTVPIYNIYSDILLNAYHKLATGATFYHPHNAQHSYECAVQYVDNKTQMVN
jgi:hypothetical protein